MERSVGRASLLSLRFVSRVGGVSFESQVDFFGREVALHCDEDAPDGVRVSIKIDGARRRLDLHDWELRPIRRFRGTSTTRPS
jgi:hypothetical protein